MKNGAVIFSGMSLFVCWLALSVAADEKRPTLVFGGQQVRVGMSQQEAINSLSRCCRLSPPVEGDVEKRPTPGGIVAGHFILSKEDSSQRILGSIYFSGGRVQQVKRPIDEELDTRNQDVVTFARAIKRCLVADGDTEITARVSIRHERASNAESDVVVLTLRNGRGIEMHVGTLDRPDPGTDKRDFVTLDETLASSSQE